MYRTSAASVLFALAGLAVAAPQTVDVASASLRAVSSAEADQIKGHFRMSDGRILHMRQRGMRMFAELSDEPAVEVRALSSQELMSVDGRMHLRFSSDETMAHVKLVIDPNAAAALAKRAKLAQAKLSEETAGR